MSSVIVTELNIYPVKSMRGLSLDSMPIGAIGPDGDRRWMLIDRDGRFISQREENRLCLVDVTLTHEQLQLSAPGQLPLCLPVALSRKSRGVQVWDDHVDAIDCGDEAASWCAGFLGRDCRLVYMPSSCHRQVDLAYGTAGDRVSFADGFPLLLISKASLESLNQRLSTPVSMHRFRPNIVVSGCEAFAEDGWKSLKIGGLEFQVAKPCSRCVIPSINPQSAEKNPEILRQLASYRRTSGKVYFGQNLIHRNQGVIALGDSLRILS